VGDVPEQRGEIEQLRREIARVLVKGEIGKSGWRLRRWRKLKPEHRLANLCHRWPKRSKSRDQSMGKK
jgi:hypothetical protein